VILTDQLEPYILEFNKGPSMNPINHEDYKLKRVVLEDTFRTAGFQSNIPVAAEANNGFIQLV
jgi:hypothetical protein